MIAQLKSALNKTINTLNTLTTTQKQQTELLELHTQQIAELLGQRINDSESAPAQDEKLEIAHHILFASGCNVSMFKLGQRIRPEDKQVIVTYSTRTHGDQQALRRWLTSKKVDYSVSADIYEYHTEVRLSDMRSLCARLNGTLDLNPEEQALIYNVLGGNSPVEYVETSVCADTSGERHFVLAYKDKHDYQRLRDWLNENQVTRHRYQRTRHHEIQISVRDLATAWSHYVARKTEEDEQRAEDRTTIDKVLRAANARHTQASFTGKGVEFSSQRSSDIGRLACWLMERNASFYKTTDRGTYLLRIDLPKLRLARTTSRRKGIDVNERLARIEFLHKHIEAGTMLGPDQVRIEISEGNGSYGISTYRRGHLNDVQRWLHLRGLKTKHYRNDKGTWCLSLEVRHALRVLTEKPVSTVTLNRGALEIAMHAMNPDCTIDQVRASISTMEVK